MPKTSAGILMYRHREGRLELLLVHPGGPYWAKKDDGAWSFPKGEYVTPEDPLTVAKREFEEETGFVVTGQLVPLPPVKQAGGKIVSVWAVEGDFDVGAIRSNTFSLEWPPRSGRTVEFPEVDRAAWFSVAEAKRKVLPGQKPLIDSLLGRLAGKYSGTSSR